MGSWSSDTSVQRTRVTETTTTFFFSVVLISVPSPVHAWSSSTHTHILLQIPMAGPSTIAENDSLLALRLQLREAGAGDVEIRSLLDLPQHAEPCPSIQNDTAMACEMASRSLSVSRDAAFAHHLSAVEYGHSCSQLDHDVMLTNLSVPPISCPICLELAPTASRFVTSCGHVFCASCMRKHLSVIALETKQLPIQCPSCRIALDLQQCLLVLAGTGHIYAAMETLILERYHHAQMRYCANESCGIPFDWDDDPELCRYTDRYCVTCPFCRENTCVQCKVMWHHDLTCEEFKSQKEGTDGLLKLAVANRWQLCPKCGHLIERQTGDCSFVKCRCGCAFCHNCGKGYLSLGATAENFHGRPDCACRLFGTNYEAPQVPRPAIQQQNQEIPNAPAQAPMLGPPELFDFEPPQPAHAIHAQGEAIRDAMVAARALALVDYGDIRDELGPFSTGANGYVGLRGWLRGVGPRRKRLPKKMADKVRAARCPYEECGDEFTNVLALEQHLSNVRRHSVFLCCGRPFSNEEGLEMHEAAVHS